MNLEKLMDVIAKEASSDPRPMDQQGLWIRADKGILDRMRDVAGIPADKPYNDHFMGLPVKKSRVQDVWTLTIYRHEEQIKTLKLVDLL